MRDVPRVLYGEYIPHLAVTVGAGGVYPTLGTPALLLLPVLTSLFPLPAAGVDVPLPAAGVDVPLPAAGVDVPPPSCWLTGMPSL